jgi:hypothetical protein
MFVTTPSFPCVLSDWRFTKKWQIVVLFQVLRSDIVMDLGKSLNPAIDIGQIGASLPHYISFDWYNVCLCDILIGVFLISQRGCVFARNWAVHNGGDGMG